MSDNNIQANNFFESINSVPLTKHAPIIVADNFKTPQNIGSLLRLAGSIGCKEVFVTDTPKEKLRLSKVKKTATTAFNTVKLTFVSTKELINEKIPTDYTPIGIETAANATNIFETKLPEKVVLFFGNEAFGVSQTILDYCKEVVYIPLPGEVKSLNVTHAAAITLFEWYRQQQLKV